MYAVIETGGKQYRVAPKDLSQDKVASKGLSQDKVASKGLSQDKFAARSLIEVEKLNAEVGETLNFPVLLLKNADASLETNPSALSHVRVTATVVDQIRGDKIKIIKFRRRKHHRKQMGHRQYYTLLKITNIGS